MLRPTIDQGVTCGATSHWPYGCSGHPNEGLRSAQQALTVATQLEHPPSIGFALNFLGMVQGYRREGHAVHEIAEQLLVVAREHELRVWRAHGAYAHGEALVLQGQYDEGSESIRQAIAECASLGIELGQTWRTARLAEAQGKMRQVEEGLVTVAAALAGVSASGERHYEAELWRLKGELTLQFSVQRLGSSVKTSSKFKVHGSKLKTPSTQPLAPSTQEAEAYASCKAIENRPTAASEIVRTPRGDEPRPFATTASGAIRITYHAPRLTHHAARRRLDDAHQMLSEIYGWFTEGFDTKDLQEAKALLDSL